MKSNFTCVCDWLCLFVAQLTALITIINLSYEKVRVFSYSDSLRFAARAAVLHHAGSHPDPSGWRLLSATTSLAGGSEDGREELNFIPHGANPGLDR